MKAQPRPAPCRLWSARVPHALGDAEADIPTLSPYLSRARPFRGALVICPGGGYTHFGDHEGHGYALWLARHGFHAFVLKYRLGSDGYRHPAMLADAARALRWVRSHARPWGIRKDRVGIVGSSAGGHLAATLLTRWDTGNPRARDPVERVSSRPDLGVLCYPVISMMTGLAHEGSRQNCLGPRPSRREQLALSAERNVSRETPPCFVWHCADDVGVPASNSLAFAEALRRAGVPFELHLYEKGGHGFGLGNHHPWGAACLRWLNERWA